MNYTAHDAFIAPARANSQLWRLAVGLLLISAVTVGWAVLLFMTLYLTAGVDGGPEWINRLSTADTPTSALLVLTMLWGLALGATLTVALVHRRKPRTLLGSRRFLKRHFVIAAAICLGIALISLFIPIGPDLEPGLDSSIWLTFLPLALLVILGQTGAEELLFRGYLQQQLAARFRSPILWMVFPSLAFGLLHYDPTVEPVVTALIIIATTLFGLFAADLTARTGSIGAAWGFHFANNVVAILFISTGDSLSGLSLYQMPLGTADTSMHVTLLLLGMTGTALIWAVTRFALARQGR